jgi:hypothetical protein
MVFLVEREYGGIGRSWRGELVYRFESTGNRKDARVSNFCSTFFSPSSSMNCSKLWGTLECVFARPLPSPLVGEYIGSDLSFSRRISSDSVASTIVGREGIGSTAHVRIKTCLQIVLWKGRPTQSSSHQGRAIRRAGALQNHVRTRAATMHLTLEARSEPAGRHASELSVELQTKTSSHEVGA